MLDWFLKFDQVQEPIQLYEVYEHFEHIPSSSVKMKARHDKYLHMVTNLLQKKYLLFYWLKVHHVLRDLHSMCIILS